jgi:hypothetical protein
MVARSVSLGKGSVDDHWSVIHSKRDPIGATVEAARRCPTQDIAVIDDNGNPLSVPK